MDNPNIIRLTQEGINAMKLARQERTDGKSKRLSNIRTVVDDQISVLQETEEDLKNMSLSGRKKKKDDEVSVVIDDEFLTSTNGDTIEKIHIDINSKPKEKNKKDKKDKSYKKDKEKKEKKLYESSKVDVHNNLLESLTNAYMSDSIAKQKGLSSVKSKIKTLYRNLMEGDDYIQDIAIVIVHLYKPNFIGAHSYTFRREVVVKNVYDLSRLDDLSYIWPEVFNNKYLGEDKEKVDKYKKFHMEEVKRMRELLSNGKTIEPSEEDDQICYEDGKCGPTACKLVTKREIYMPEMHEGKVKGYCFDNDTLFDIILSSTVPINPYTKNPFPEHLVKNVKQKYKDELLMRAYFRLTRSS